MSRRAVLAALAVALAGLVMSGPARAQAPAFKVVAHPNVGGNTVSKAILADIFMGRLVRWADGKPIQAVDQSMTSAVRQQFSEKVLGQTTMAVNHHWMRQISSGKRPPIVKNSDADVLQWVAAHEGAIGYVAADAVVPATVKVLGLQ